MFVVNFSELGGRSERLRACRVRYGMDGIIMEFKISV